MFEKHILKSIRNSLGELAHRNRISLNFKGASYLKYTSHNKRKHAKDLLSDSTVMGSDWQ